MEDTPPFNSGNPAHQTTAGASPVRCHSLVGVFVLLIFAITLASLDLVAHAAWMSKWLDGKALAQAATNPNIRYRHTLIFADEGDRLVLCDLPQADYTAGGVYVIGSSTAQNAFNDWEVPTIYRSRVGNYGIGALNQHQALQFIDFLTRCYHFSSVGRKKLLVIIGLSYLNAGPHDSPVFRSTFERSGLYRYDDIAGVQPVKTNRLIRTYLFERATCRSLLVRLVGGTPTEPVGPLNKSKFKTLIQDKIMGPDWVAAMDRQNQELARMLDLLKAHDIQTIGVILPFGTWADEQPYENHYQQETVENFRRHGLPLIDCGRLLPDDQFIDHAHISMLASRKMHDIIWSLGLKHFESIDGNDPPHP